jgi:fluoride exporter
VTFLAVALGGAAGALLRWWLGEAVPNGGGFPWTTFAINVSGSLVLAVLPALNGIRRRPALAAALGPGVLGGYTTLSAYAEESRALLASGELFTATTYVVGTLAACLVAVALATGLSSPEAHAEFAAEKGDE